ncbi:MAG: DNA/RNA non-specific endonuclease, partial [Methylococcaceae bacterium]|nr:DNA/RNA non-specific endonuclease [Methylococcaceae bacterium]
MEYRLFLFLDSIAAIAAGQVANAAKKVEQTMANTLTVIIAFLAKFAGLGNIPEKIVGIIKKIRQPIDKGLDKIVAWLGGLLKKAGQAVVDWWKEKLGFTNKDGESHTLQFIGTGDSAKMGIATSLTPVRTYLDNHPDKGTPAWDTANSVFNSAMQIVFTPAAKSQAEKDRRAAIKQELAKVSAAFAKLAGSPPTEADYGKNTPPTYGNPAKVDVIVGAPLAGSITGAWPTTMPGYKEIYDAGLTTATDRWVQMHIISEKLGGSGTDFNNLVPAPNSVNTGPFRSFEHSTAALARAKSGNIKNRVWVEVQVSGTKSAATG